MKLRFLELMYVNENMLMLEKSQHVIFVAEE